MDTISRKKRTEIIKKNINALSEENLKKIDKTIKNFLDNVETESKEHKMTRIMLEIINKILEYPLRLILKRLFNG